MDNLTIDEINQLLIDAGETVQVDSIEFIQINASDEAQYAVTYGEGRVNHVFVYELDGTYEISFADFGDDDETLTEPEFTEEGAYINPNL